MWRVFLSMLGLLTVLVTIKAETYKRLPPPGIEIDAPTGQLLRVRVERLQKRLESATSESNDRGRWKPDVEVLIRAVRLALDQHLFFKESQTKDAAILLDEAERRLDAAKAGDRGLRLLGLSGETSGDPQLLVGGFTSRIDDSVQPFGLVIPSNFVESETSPSRMDVWLHGRGDTKTEVPFLRERMTKAGQYTPAETIVLHPFGRHCNAFKFAGERDVYEAMDHVKHLVSIDTDRIAIRGFSMGGAGCWHLGVHDPSRWFAVNPGAGFVDTLVYQKWNDSPPFPLDPIQKKLLLWYDVLPWVENLKNTNTIAYGGENDPQKQASDRALAASKATGFDWPLVVGKGMGHKIDPASAETIETSMVQWASATTQVPRQKIDFVTHTLRYHDIDWLSVTGIKEHWQPSRVRASITADDAMKIETEGVTQLELDFHESEWPIGESEIKLTIDGERILVSDQDDDSPGLQCKLRRAEQWNQWIGSDKSLRKRPGMQGPIDDAFCERFLFVVPSRPAAHGVVQRWIDRELAYAQKRWQRLMRGNVRIVNDTDLTQQDVDTNHLICFGDFGSNKFLRDVAGKLPIQWTRNEIRVAEKTFDPSTHAVTFCYPNPRNPDRYVVANSGMTFREFSNTSNSRQIAMLPDWAVLNVEDQDDAIFAGKVIAKGFFDEAWQLTPLRPSRSTIDETALFHEDPETSVRELPGTVPDGD